MGYLTRLITILLLQIFVSDCYSYANISSSDVFNSTEITKLQEFFGKNEMEYKIEGNKISINSTSLKESVGGVADLLGVVTGLFGVGVGIPGLVQESTVTSWLYAADDMGPNGMTMWSEQAGGRRCCRNLRNYNGGMGESAKTGMDHASDRVVGYVMLSFNPGQCFRYAKTSVDNRIIGSLDGRHAHGIIVTFNTFKYNNEFIATGHPCYKDGLEGWVQESGMSIRLNREDFDCSADFCAVRPYAWNIWKSPNNNGGLSGLGCGGGSTCWLG